MDDPSFQRTWQNMSEFGSAASMSRQIRQQLNNITRGAADSSSTNRLISRWFRRKSEQKLKF
ncbi:hypothetical protein M8998_05240 [Sphingobacterium sp. lm-10]|uniref:hypothetical protein n=1 Tax=Sphingobacterium sp. lm-10 TaxID=2944904 RepID=UPI002020CDA0|nr:hypothetical protein [Sphingobacterium sp. lm-10]MCL7987343.1 hypothetical protein [Sphingobacterium sp. lm-10]